MDTFIFKDGFYKIKTLDVLKYYTKRGRLDDEKAKRDEEGVV